MLLLKSADYEKTVTKAENSSNFCLLRFVTCVQPFFCRYMDFHLRNIRRNSRLLTSEFWTATQLQEKLVVDQDKLLFATLVMLCGDLSCELKPLERGKRRRKRGEIPTWKL